MGKDENLVKELVLMVIETFAMLITIVMAVQFSLIGLKLFINAFQITITEELVQHSICYLFAFVSILTIARIAHTMYTKQMTLIEAVCCQIFKGALDH